MVRRARSGRHRNTKPDDIPEMLAFEEQLTPALIDQLDHVLGLRGTGKRTLAAAGALSVQDWKRTSKIVRTNVRLSDDELSFLVRSDWNWIRNRRVFGLIEVN